MSACGRRGPTASAVFAAGVGGASDVVRGASIVSTRWGAPPQSSRAEPVTTRADMLVETDGLGVLPVHGELARPEVLDGEGDELRPHPAIPRFRLSRNSMSISSPFTVMNARASPFPSRPTTRCSAFARMGGSVRRRRSISSGERKSCVASTERFQISAISSMSSSVRCAGAMFSMAWLLVSVPPCFGLVIWYPCFSRGRMREGNAQGEGSRRCVRKVQVIIHVGYWRALSFAVGRRGNSILPRCWNESVEQRSVGAPRSILL